MRVVVALAVAGAQAASAQGHPFAPIVLQVPGGTRAVAMGNVNVGGRDDDVLFYNPAQLAVARGTSASAELYSAGDVLTTVSTVTALGSGGVGVGVQNLTYATSGEALPDPRVLGSSAGRPADGMVAAVGYAQRLFGTRVGIVSKLVQDESLGARDTRPAFDAGVARDLLLGTFGLSLQNLGEAMRTPSGRVPMPARATLGYQASGLAAGPLDLAAAAAVSMTRGRSVSGGVGAEVSYGWIDGYSVSLRGGARRAEDDAAGRWTTGLGLTADRVTLEYAFETRRDASGAHRLGLRIR